MPVPALWRWSLIVVSLLAAGCAQNPYVLQRQAQVQQQQQVVLAQRNQELERRASELDQHNQELSTLLAQSRQQGQMLQDQLAATREPLGSTASQVAQLREERQLIERKAEALTASTRRRASAAISANNSLQETLPTFNVAGVEVRRDGDVIRVEVPADLLFDAGSGQFRPGAGRIVDDLADVLAREYSNQFIGIEGHTDSQSGQSRSHQLSLARASAVFEQLSARSRLRPDQLFIAGHGGNHPVVSNATPAGRARNNRIELVIYPEQASG